MKQKLRKITTFLLCAVIILLMFSGCKKEATEYNDISDLNGKRIIVVTGTIHDEVIASRDDLKDAEVLYANTAASAVVRLLAGKADGMVVDYLSGKSFAKQYRELKILENPLDSSEYGFGFKKNDPLISEYNRVLAEMKADGRLDALIEKWTNEDKTPALTKTTANATKVVRVLGNAESAPFCYRDNSGNVAGLDIDILTVISNELGYKLETDTADFDTLIPAVMTGKADIITSDITITEDRAQLIDFSDSYYEDNAVMLVKREGSSSFFNSLILRLKTSVNVALISNGRWLSLLKGLGITVVIALITLLLGSILGFAGFLGHYTENKIALAVLDTIDKIYQLLPSSTWIFICYYLIVPGSQSFWAALIALTVDFAHNLYDLFCLFIDRIPTGQVEAAITMGYGKYRALFKLFLKQSMHDILDETERAVILHIDTTSLVGLIAVQDIQAVADTIALETGEALIPMIITAVAYMLFAALLGYIVKLIRVKFFPGKQDTDEMRRRAERRLNK